MSKEQAAIFMDHIRENAARYFEGFEPAQIEVRLNERQERPSSMLYQFTVGDKVQNRGIIVKVPLYRGYQSDKSGGTSSYKPELFPKTEPRDTHRLGYIALRSISEYFSSLDEKQLGTVRVLDYLPEHHAIFTEASRDPNLRKLFLATSRLRAGSNSRELELPFRNVGKWLRLYHEMSKEDNVQIRHAHRHDYIEAVVTLTDFLGNALKDETFFRTIATTLGSSALEILPGSLPLGLGHGDFAMRNILVGSNARITVIDTFAKWRTPIYEDIGYFLNGLKRSAAQVISQGLLFGLAQISNYERAFLEGYFEKKPIPYPEIRLYEMLSLLDKWCSIVTHYRQRGGKFKNFGMPKAILTNRYFKINAKRLLKEVTKSETR